MYPKITISSLNQIKIELLEKVNGSFISNVTLISNIDFVLSFSHFRKEKLLISLNHQSPFLSLIETDESFQTIMGVLNDVLRKEIKDAKIVNIETSNNDRIIRFHLTKTNEVFEKINKTLVLELIPRKPNLIIVDDDDNIVFATHYTDLTNDRIIKQKFKYTSPKSDLKNSGVPIDLIELKSQAKDYLKVAKENRQKNKSKDLIDFVEKRIKILKNKLIKLQKDIDTAKDKIIYEEYGQMCYMLLSNPDDLNNYIEQKIINDYDLTLSIKENANRYFKLSKKAKTTLKLAKEEIIKAENDIMYFEHIKIQIENGSDDDINEIRSLFFKKEINNKKKTTFTKVSPYYVLVEGVKIAFGKTDLQNDELTFKRAKYNYPYFHIKDYSGAHVVIMSENYTNEQILTACEIALILSKKESGDVISTLVKHVYKGHKIGQVNIKENKNIFIKDVRKNTIKLLEKPNRL